MSIRTWGWLCLGIAASLTVGAYELADRPTVQAAPATAAEIKDRSPVDLALTPDGHWLCVVNQTADTVSLVRLSDSQIVAEVGCGRRPSAIATSADGTRVFVTATDSGELRVFERGATTLKPLGTVMLKFEPRGLAISPDGRWAYVALTAANAVSVVDLTALREVERIEVGSWPRYLCLTPDGSRLAVGTSGDGGVSVIDTGTRHKLFDTKFQGLNIGHLQCSADGRYAYFPWMVYADRPITPGNIREGWVMGNRVARVRLDEAARREALALDPRGKAVADPHGLALSPGDKWLALAASGTHELVAFKLEELPLRPDGPGDHLNPQIAADGEQFFRVPLGGRPMGMRFDAAGEKLYVANYLNNSVQVVDFAGRRVEREIALGGPAEPSLARRGEAIFHDANRSVDGWYSCHSCHYEGGTNAVTMDTKNDGSFGTYKMVLSLQNVKHTGPWFWHGWQQNADEAVAKSLVDTMQGPKPSADEVSQMMAYLDTLTAPASSWRAADGSLTAQAQRGKQVFEGDAANCAACHSGPYFTDGQVHDVGLGSEYDKYSGYNTPSLVGAGNRARYLHHGRALSLADLLTDLHSPAKVSNTRELEPQELADLVAYLRAL